MHGLMRSARTLLLNAGALALMVFLTLGTGSSTAFADTASTATAVESSVTSFMGQQLDSYQGSEGPFQTGVWTDTADTCWACDNGGPATAAATQYVLTGASNPTLLNEAKETIYVAIAADQNPDGSFNPPNTAANVDNSIWFGDELGTTYRLLAPYLSTQTLAAWGAALSADANYLIDSGNTSWYINGNINLAETELLWLAWQATGNQTFETAYDDSWAYIMNPPQTKFPGAGWITVTSPTQADGSDGQGYFAETGAGTGWDPYYSTLQLDIAARLYLLSGDPRALRVTNMIMNLESPLVDTSDWILNTSYGTRHIGVGTAQFITSAYAVLGFEGGRADLLADVLPQLQDEEQWYIQSGAADLAGFRRAFGNSVAVIALAAALADPATSSTVSKYGVLGPNSPTPTSTSTSTATSTTATTSTGPTFPPATSPPTTSGSAAPTPSTPVTSNRGPKPTARQQLVQALHDYEFFARDYEDLGSSVARARGKPFHKCRTPRRHQRHRRGV
jgi:hypothetical protein